MARFADVLTIINGKNQRNVENPNGPYPIYGSGGIMGYADDFICDGETVIIGRKGSINKPIFVDVPFWNVDTAFGLSANCEVLFPKYLYYFCEKFDFEKLNTTVTIPSLTRANLLNIEIPLPSLNRQKEVATILDKISSLTVRRKQQLAKLDELVKARFVEMFGDQYNNDKHWPIAKLGGLFKISSSKRIYQSEQVPTGVPFYRISDLMKKIATGTANAELFISIEAYDNLKKNGLVPRVDDILVTSRGTLGQCYVVTEQDEFYFQDGMISWLSDRSENVVIAYITQLFLMEGFRKQIDDVPTGTTVNYLSIEKLKNLDIMLPPVELQQKFVELKVKISKYQLTIHQSLDKLEVLKKALMQEYFG